MLSSLFPATYEEARQRFLDSAAGAGGRVTSHPNNAMPPSGGHALLATDTAWFGAPEADRLLICLSGTHGAEGFAGSGVQTAWIEDGGAERLPAGVAVLLVHAVNPYGFAALMRSNEGNVDINRNWIDFERPLPENPLYAELHRTLCPDTIDEAALQAAAAGVAELSERHDRWELEDALSRGQYSHPGGYYYGGTGPTAERRLLSGIAANLPDSVRKVGIVDLHSGPVGDGNLIFLVYADRSTDAFARAESWWGADNLDTREVDRLWGGRRPGRNGVLVEGLSDILEPGREVAGGVVEFCSAGPPTGPAGAFRIPMLERWMRFVGGPAAPESERIREEIRDNYAPRRQSWEDRVVENGLALFADTLNGIAGWE